MAGEFTEFFNELLFGTGAWLGLILIVAIIALVTAKEKLTGGIFLPIAIFIGIEYFMNVPSNSNFMWAGIIMFVMAIYCLAMLIKGVKR